MVCYDQNLQKHKYLSTISIFLHENLQNRARFPSQSKWVQTVVCYDQNLQKHKYLSTISIFLHETFRTGLIFQASRNESKQWYAMIKTYKNINISAWYQYFCMKPSEQGSFFWASRNESKQWYAMIKTYKNINISAQYQYFCTKPSEQGSFFWAVEMSPNSGMLFRSKLTKIIKHISQHNINISAQNLQNRAHFSELVKWVQTVVCYDQNLQKHKYLSMISIFLHKTFRTGSIFQAGRNESKQWYAMIKTYKNINISAQYQYFCMKPSEQGSFFQDSRNESKQWYAMIKTYKNINISAQYQYFCIQNRPQNRAHFSEPVEMSPNSGMLWSKLTKT